MSVSLWTETNKYLDSSLRRKEKKKARKAEVKGERIFTWFLWWRFWWHDVWRGVNTPVSKEPKVKKKKRDWKMSHFQKDCQGELGCGFHVLSNREFPFAFLMCFFFLFLSFYSKLWVFRNCNWPCSYRRLKSSLLQLKRRTSLPSITPLNNNICWKEPIWGRQLVFSFGILIIIPLCKSNIVFRKGGKQENHFVNVCWERGRGFQSHLLLLKGCETRRRLVIICRREQLSLLVSGSFHFWPAWGIAILAQRPSLSQENIMLFSIFFFSFSTNG